MREQLGRAARELCALARAGETAEVRTTRLIRRKHRVSPGGVQSGASITDPMCTVLRLAAGGRDVYVSADSTAGRAGPELLASARALLPWGRVYRDATALRQASRWDATALNDADLGTPAGPLLRLRAAADLLAKDVATRQGTDIQIADWVVTEQVRIEAFATASGHCESYACTTLEIKILAQVRRDGRQLKVWSARHASRLRDIEVEDLLIEAGWRAAAMLAPPAPATAVPATTGPAAGQELLLAPTVSAAVLRVLVQDLIDGRLGPRRARPLPHAMVDDAHAAGGPHARPFDHEGVPTGESVLLDRDGTVGALACRGESWVTDAAAGSVILTGNATLPALKGVPEVQPTNVRLARGQPYELPGDYTGVLGFAARGEGIQRYRSGDQLRFRIETAHVRDGVVARRGLPLLFAGSLPELLGAVRAVAPPLTYLPWRDYSTAGSWMLLTNLPGIAALPTR